MSRTPYRPGLWLARFVCALLLAAALATWAHPAAHAGEVDDGACVTCDWLQHAPAVTGATPPQISFAAALVVDAAPARDCPPAPRLGTPHVRGPPPRVA